MGRGRTFRAAAKVRPSHGNVRAAAVRQHQHEMRLSAMPQLGEHFEHLPFEGMVWTGDSNLAGEVAEVGSVS